MVTLVTVIAKKLEIPTAYDPELTELATDVHPEAVLDTMEPHDPTPS